MGTCITKYKKQIQIQIQIQKQIVPAETSCECAPCRHLVRQPADGHASQNTKYKYKYKYKYKNKLFQRRLPVSAHHAATWSDNLRMDMHHKIQKYKYNYKNKLFQRRLPVSAHHVATWSDNP